MSNDDFSISAILVESDGSITLAGSGGMVFLNADGTPNYSLGDSTGGSLRKGYAANADIGFVTGLQDYAGGFVITSGNVEGPIDVMRMDANGQVNHSFGDYGIVETSYGGTWYNPKTTVVTADSQIVTAFLDDSTDTYILEWLNGSGTVVSTTTMDLEKLDSLSLGADGTILAFGIGADDGGDLVTVGSDGTVLSETSDPAYTYADYHLDVFTNSDGQIIAAGGIGYPDVEYNLFATATRVWVQQDANWNVTSIEDSSGNVLERYVTDPYGQFAVTDAAGTVKTGGSDYNWTDGWEGKFINYISNSWYSRNRDYDITTETWNQRDPLDGGYADSMDPYLPMLRNPLNGVDPSGLFQLVAPAPTIAPGGGGATLARIATGVGVLPAVAAVFVSGTIGYTAGTKIYQGAIAPGISDDVIYDTHTPLSVEQKFLLLRQIKSLKTLAKFIEKNGTGGPPKVPKIGGCGNSGCDELIDLVVGGYGEIKGTLPDGFQAHHLNQNAAFKGIISQFLGVAVGLIGDAFKEAMSEILSNPVD